MRKRGRPPIDITGQRFGTLTAAHLVPSIEGRPGAMWHVVCDCGDEFDVRYSVLIVGGRTRCNNREAHAIPKEERPKRVLKNYTGQRFGKLLVLRESPKEHPGPQRHWECRCDCGMLTYVRTNSLTSGHTKSCGCERRNVVSSFPSAPSITTEMGHSRRRGIASDQSF